MPTKPTPKIKAWSFSRFNTYEECPAKAKYKFIDRLEEPGSAAMDRGSQIHKLAEHYLTGALKDIPSELANFKDEFIKLKKLKPLTEQQVAFSQQWVLTEWFGWQAWCRVIMDASAKVKTKLRIIDFKTGKVKPPEVLVPQLELYALAGFKMDPKIKEVEAELWYLDAGEEQKKVFKLADVPKLEALWVKRTTPMLNDQTFSPRPGNACRWCHFSKAKQGPCKF